MGNGTATVHVLEGEDDGADEGVCEGADVGMDEGALEGADDSDTVGHTLPSSSTISA